MHLSINVQRQMARYSVPILVSLFIVFQVWKITFSDKPSALQYDISTRAPLSSVESKLQRIGRAAIKISEDTMFNHHSNITRYQSPTAKNLTHFPYGDIVRPTKEILSSFWVPALQLELTKLSKSSETIQSTNKQVTVVVSDTKYKASLLNWLVAALIHTNPPLNNIIIISLDRSLQDFLHDKDILTVYIDPKTVIRTGTKMHSQFSHIWITRCVVYNLLNYWGYDVVVYDSDATVLKNLQPIFDEHQESDVIGTLGSYPFQLGRKWGHTVCMGVALFRSTQRTDMLWEAMSHTRTDSFDDQVKLNYVLQGCHIQWQSTGRSTSNQSVTGQCDKNHLGGLKVTILPESIVCRHCQSGEQNTSYYVWHDMAKKTAKAKLKIAQQGKVWYLNDKWNNSTRDGSKLTGLEWLRTISNESL